MRTAGTSRRKGPLIAVFVALLAFSLIVAPAGAKRKPPRIAAMPVALYNAEDETLGFSATVFRARSVTIRYGDRQRKAERIRQPGDGKITVPFTWQASFSDGTRKRCYRIEVIARNRNQTASREITACRLSTPSRPTDEGGHHSPEGEH